MSGSIQSQFASSEGDVMDDVGGNDWEDEDEDEDENEDQASPEGSSSSTAGQTPARSVKAVTPE